MTEIITLADDEKITEPGFYRISLDRHHSQPCDGVSVTSGILRTMELENPEKVWAFHQLNPNRWERKTTDALRLGSAMAAFIEGGLDELKTHYQLLPPDKPNRPNPAQIAKYEAGEGTPAGIKSVEFWAAVDADPRPIITEAELSLIADMGGVLVKDELAKLMLSGEPEITMAWQHEGTGIWCLARPDNVTFDGATADYKKISTQGQPFTHWLVDRRIERHGYVQQMAFASEGLERLTNQWPSAVGLVFQSDARPHQVITRDLLEEDLRIHQWLNDQAIWRFHECLTSGYWPGPAADIAAYQMDDKRRERYLERMNTAGVAP